MAAGKSTVSGLLAGRFERGVHLEGDVFRRSIVSGRVEMTPDAGEDALAQLRLRYQLAVDAAEAYRDAGFAVVWEDVVAGPLLAEAVALVRVRPLHVVVLLPRREVVTVREAGRADKGYGAWSVDALYDGFANDTPRLGLWLDSSDETPEETVDRILATAGKTPAW
jgi:chloramphenicol 3-O-phosphotransferase